MSRIKEKSIDRYNKDVEILGGYAYTSDKLYSSSVARKREYNEIIRFIKIFFNKRLSILDVGCGDGEFEIELFNRIHPKFIFGFDYSKKGIAVANKRVLSKYKNRIKFKQIDIYDIDKYIKKDDFDVVIISGVLHHLYKPTYAIKKIGKFCNDIIVLEANGYNPILKIIEKISPYHIQHEEKSYWPPTLNKWFTNQGFEIKKQYYFGLVPYFCYENVARFLKKIEPIIERIPLINKFVCRTNLIYYSRTIKKV